MHQKKNKNMYYKYAQIIYFFSQINYLNNIKMRKTITDCIELYILYAIL